MRTAALPSLILVGFVACAGSSSIADGTTPPQSSTQFEATPPSDGSPGGEASQEAQPEPVDETVAANEAQPADAQQNADGADPSTASADADANEKPSPLEALAGEYRYAGGKDAISQSIDEVVDEMSIFARGIARDRLTEANGAPRRIVIEPKGDKVTVTIDGETFTATVGGKAVEVPNSEGSTSRMRFRMQGNSLVQIFDAESGDRINVFTPRNGGKSLSFQVTMKSSKLPKDVKYRLAYR